MTDHATGSRASEDQAVLVVVAGLPATGKSTVAAIVVSRLRASYLRIDTIEQALRDAGEMSPTWYLTGYRVGYALATEQLRLGLTVVAECVNPFDVTRQDWRKAAADAGCPVVEVELVCTDEAGHRRRARERVVDVPGLVLPSWSEIAGREREPWTTPHLVIDTAQCEPDTAADLIIREIETRFAD